MNRRTNWYGCRVADHAQPEIVLVSPDERMRGRVEGAARQGGWVTSVSTRLAEAEHGATARTMRSLVLMTADGTDDTLHRLGRQHPTMAVFVWAAGLGSEACARLLLAGAADTLAPTMSELEVFARLARVLAPHGGHGAEASRFGHLQVDSFRGEASWHDTRIPLTNRERDVLDVLIRERGQTLRRDVIYHRVWGHAMPAGDRNVDVNVKRLRSKLSAATGDLVVVETISRVGYRLHVSDQPPPGDSP